MVLRVVQGQPLQARASSPTFLRDPTKGKEHGRDAVAPAVPEQGGSHAKKPCLQVTCRPLSTMEGAPVRRHQQLGGHCSVRPGPC